jgi:hypothetical protein
MKNILKTWNIRISIAVMALFSLFLFASGLSLKNSTETIPWWLSLIFGWCGLTVSLKLSNLWDDKK